MIFALLSRLIAPPVCFACRELMLSDVLLCVGCMQRITPVASTYLDVTASFRVLLHAVGAYEYPFQPLLYSKHYRDAVTWQRLGEFLYDNAPINWHDYDCIVPVPLHWSRKARRGFNQAEILAQELQKRSGTTVVPAVVRARRTGPQARRPHQERQKNVRGAFAFVPKCTISGKRVLVVDDVVTTGATVVQVVTELRKGRPHSIEVVALCRGGIEHFARR